MRELPKLDSRRVHQLMIDEDRGLLDAKKQVRKAQLLEYVGEINPVLREDAVQGVRELAEVVKLLIRRSYGEDV